MFLRGYDEAASEWEIVSLDRDDEADTAWWLNLCH